MANAHILLLDDEPINTQVLRYMLERSAYTTDRFHDAQIAFNALKASPTAYDLIITDRIMPDMDGLALVKSVKATPELASMPIIMQTGAAEKNEHIDAIKAGVFDFVFKPLEKELLLGVVRRALQVQR